MSERTSGIGSGARRHTRLGSGLYAHVVNALGQSIIDGTMPAGQVVIADQLVEELDVSRSVVREGLRTLSSMGLIEARPQVGTRVLPMQRWDLLNPQVVNWRAQSKHQHIQMLQILEFRLGIEPAAARLAAQRISDDDADELVNAAQAMGAAFEVDDRPRFFTADANYHRLILEGSDNPVIAQFADTVEATLHSRTRDARAESLELNALSLQRHVDLAQAIRQRDSEGSERLAREIIDETLREYAG